MLEKYSNFQDLTARDIMTINPKTINKDELAIDALSIMRENNITQLPIMDNGKYAGIIHLHDILKEGIF